jgi:hypothetical protein
VRSPNQTASAEVGTNVFTVQNPPGSGGFNAEIDNILYSGTNVLSIKTVLPFCWSTGLPFTFLPMAIPETAARVQVDIME